MKDNKLIADFMELEVDNGLYCYTTAIDDYKTDTLYFHSSWDWLMPVISKCRIESNSEDDYWEGIYYTLEECDIDITYPTVIEFIKRTNLNKQ